MPLTLEEQRELESLESELGIKSDEDYERFISEMGQESPELTSEEWALTPLTPAEEEELATLEAELFPPPPMSGPAAIWQGIREGTIVGDELSDILAAGVAAPAVEEGVGELYGQARDISQQRLAQAREEHPYLTGAGEFASALATGAGAIKGLGKGGAALTGRYAPQLPGQIQRAAGAVPGLVRGAARNLGVGAGSAYLYGAGTGEGGLAERQAAGAELAPYGAAFGAISPVLGLGVRAVAPTFGKYIGQPISEALSPLAAKAVNALNAKRAKLKNVASDEFKGSGDMVDEGTHELAKQMDKKGFVLSRIETSGNRYGGRSNYFTVADKETGLKSTVRLSDHIANEFFKPDVQSYITASNPKDMSAQINNFTKSMSERIKKHKKEMSPLIKKATELRKNEEFLTEWNQFKKRSPHLSEEKKLKRRLALEKKYGIEGLLNKKSIVDIIEGVSPPIEAGVFTRVTGDPIEEFITKQEVLGPVEGGEKAYKLVSKQLKEDLGDDYKDVITAFKAGDKSIADLFGSRTTTLAQGAAQYPGGKARAQQYFSKRLDNAYEDVIDSVNTNISSIENYYVNAEDLLNLGRKKAAPVYEKAFNGGIPIKSDAVNEILETSLGQKALKDSARALRDDLDLRDIPDVQRDIALIENNLHRGAGLSLRTLDKVKRSLDNELTKVSNKMSSTFDPQQQRLYTSLTTKLRESLDAADPTNQYVKARGIGGDYLATNSAMEKGRKSLGSDYELLSMDFQKMNESEKLAFQIGLGKAIRDVAVEGGNVYKKIFGSIDAPQNKKRKALSSVLTPKQFKKVELDVRAYDRLYKQRNEILGGSPTAGKLEARGMISSGAVEDIIDVPSKVMIKGLQKAKETAFRGLNDKTASKVAEILYETDPVKKLMILDKLKISPKFTKEEKKLVKKAYFTASDKFDVSKIGQPAAAGILPAIGEEE